MNTVLSPQAAKYLKRLNEPDKSRIIKALKKLEHEPPEGDIILLNRIKLPTRLSLRALSIAKASLWFVELYPVKQ